MRSSSPSTCAHNGVDGLHLAMEGDYHLLVLDGMLPGIDGLGLLAALRQSKQTPVLMLTARVRVEDRVKGLQGGADDYLLKPFAFSELVARIEVLLRRARPTRDLEASRNLSERQPRVDHCPGVLQGRTGSGEGRSSGDFGLAWRASKGLEAAESGYRRSHRVNPASEDGNVRKPWPISGGSGS